jgi:AcrR family transcriptional regulator
LICTNDHSDCNCLDSHPLSLGRGVNEKQTIIAKATGRFAAQGHELTTALQIAGEVGTAAPAVFYNLKNKQTLYSTISEDASDRYLERALALKL